MLGTGKSVVKALEVLSQHKVDGKKVIVLTLFVTPESKFVNDLHRSTISKRGAQHFLGINYACHHNGFNVGMNMLKDAFWLHSENFLFTAKACGALQALKKLLF